MKEPSAATSAKINIHRIFTPINSGFADAFALRQLLHPFKPDRYALRFEQDTPERAPAFHIGMGGRCLVHRKYSIDNNFERASRGSLQHFIDDRTNAGPGDVQLETQELDALSVKWLKIDNQGSAAGLTYCDQPTSSRHRGQRALEARTANGVQQHVDSVTFRQSRYLCGGVGA
jgi:hypothetical protein